MSDVIDFIARKAEAEGVSDDQVSETPRLENLRLTCNTCGCMSFEVDGHNFIICAGCNSQIVDSDDVNLIANAPKFDPSLVAVVEEPRAFTAMNNLSLEKFIELLRKDDSSMVFVMAAYASGTIRYRVNVPIETTDEERINWIYERTSRMLECEGVDLGVGDGQGN